MAHKQSFIPGPGPAYDTFFKNICQYVNTKCTGSTPEWTHIPAAERTALNDAYADWYTGYTPTLKPHTPAETAARKRSKKVLSRFIQVWLRGFPEVVTEADLRNMAIPPIDSVRSPIPPPEIQVEADLVFPGIHLVELRKIRPMAGLDRPDPRSDYGVRIYYALSGEPSERFPFRLASPLKIGKVLPYSVFTRRRKERFDFNGESGSAVYFCLRYENSKGDAGPFGPVLSAVVP
jgi:hypothetical protein